MGATQPSSRSLGGLLCVMALMGTHCADQEAIAARQQAEAARDRVTAELSEAQATKVKADKALAEAKAALEKRSAKLAAVKAENAKLQKTVRYFLDQAVSTSTASDDDDGNKGAIKAYQALIDTFPDHPLAEVSGQRIEALEERIAARAEKLAHDQAEVLELVAACRKSAADANEAHQKSLQSKAAGDLKKGAALAGNRRVDELREMAKTAKQKAQKLLETAPDPNGRLAKQIRSCDETD